MAESLQEEHQQVGDLNPETPATTTTPTTNLHGDSAPPSTKQRRPSIDKDAQEMVIDSLRTQIQDLISQVSELNNKLVKSYDRVSDLEDDLHLATANTRTSSLKISQLELERTQHLAALNTGLLVEKSHVTAELTRLMEKATEEAAQRGQAESARNAIEKDLDDLSATLFGQANSMVAEARFEKHLSERKVEDAERALKSAEEIVQLMQTQMQTLQSDKEKAEQKTREMELVMGKGKWVASDTTISLRLLSTHSPYQEFLAFITHLRVLHPTAPQPPAVSTLLQLPFLSRLLTEDSEQTVRLDLAPSLNWLSRRSVLTAIHSGQLMIEPMSAATLFAESTTYPTSTTIAGINSSNDNITCALCGTFIFPTAESSQHTRPPVHPLSNINHPSTTSWSGSLFKKAGSIGYGNGNTAPSSPIRSYPNLQVFIFRLASLPTSGIASLPIPSLGKSSAQSYSSPIPSSFSTSTSNGSSLDSQTGTPTNNQPTTIYPLCMSGWCLTRLRSTCTLWAFVRTGIVEKVWEEEIPAPPAPPSIIQVEKSSSGEKPPLPPRKRGLWGIASAIGERAASWSEIDKGKASSTPPPPPHHPGPAPRRVPPPLPPADPPKPPSNPPPLPKRHEQRERTPRKLPPAYTANENASTSPTRATATPTPASPSTPTDANILPVTLFSTDVHTDQPTPSTNVALPDSRPATPTPPSRTNSTAVVMGSPGAPPPIPRRAAARVRDKGNSRPVTPANANAQPAPVAQNAVADASAEGKESSTEIEGASHAQEEVNRTEAEVEVDATIANADNDGELVDAEKPTEKESVAEPLRHGSPESEVYVDAPTPGAVDDEPVADKKPEEKDSDDDDDKRTVMETHDLVGSASEKPVVNGIFTEEPVHVNGLQESENEIVDEEQEEEECVRKEKDPRVYVGDSTWEERTWKEIVKLREDMFWARIGGVRE